MHFAQLADRHVRVDLSAGEAVVTQDRLNVPDVGTVVEHEGGSRVAKQMARAPLGDACLVQELAHLAGELIGMHRAAAAE